MSETTTDTRAARQRALIQARQIHGEGDMDADVLATIEAALRAPALAVEQLDYVEMAAEREAARLLQVSKLPEFRYSPDEAKQLARESAVMVAIAATIRASREG